MEMLMISDEKLKIVLSAEDLEDFGLGAEEPDYSKTETKRMIWDLLGRAKKKFGFTTEGHRMLIQLFPCRQGGCEIFICRMNRSEEAEELRVESSSKKTESLSARRGAYAFDALDSLLRVCRRLSEIGFSGESRAYYGDDRRYYLLLSGMNPSDYLPFDEYSFIEEYGRAESHEALSHRLPERARMICSSDAVSILGEI